MNNPLLVNHFLPFTLIPDITFYKVFLKIYHGLGSRGGKNTIETLYKKDLHDPDNHDGVITNRGPDIQECKVKWALGSITTNKASERDGIPVELFQVLEDAAAKVLHSI